MNQTTKHFRNIVGDGAELGRLFAGLASGQRIEVTSGQFLPAQCVPSRLRCHCAPIAKIAMLKMSVAYSFLSPFTRHAGASRSANRRLVSSLAFWRAIASIARRRALRLLILWQNVSSAMIHPAPLRRPRLAHSCHYSPLGH